MNDTSPAFPIANYPLNGLNKREYAAIHIMPAIIAKFDGYDRETIAGITVKYVDALFRRLEE